MKTAFIVLGVVLVILFLVWIVAARPEPGRKRKVLALDMSLILVSTAVLTVGFMMRSEYIADKAAALEAGDGPGKLELDEPEPKEAGEPEDTPGPGSQYGTENGSEPGDAESGEGNEPGDGGAESGSGSDEPGNIGAGDGPGENGGGSAESGEPGDAGSGERNELGGGAENGSGPDAPGDAGADNEPGESGGGSAESGEPGDAGSGERNEPGDNGAENGSGPDDSGDSGGL